MGYAVLIHRAPQKVSVPVRGMRDLYLGLIDELVEVYHSFRPRQGNEGFVFFQKIRFLTGRFTSFPSPSGE